MGKLKLDFFFNYIYPVIHRKSKYLLVFFFLLFSIFSLQPLPQHGAILSFCFHTYSLSHMPSLSRL